MVTALGIKREEKALGYAVQKVDGDKLAAVKTVNVATSLTGKIAGLNVKNSTEFNTSPSLSLRASAPLLVVIITATAPPRAPYRAEAVAPFKTSTDSMSSAAISFNPTLP